jgi:hypothetical protein
MTPLYSIGTWDTEAQAYTPQIGVSKTFNVTHWELLRAMRKLKTLGYSCHRRGDKREELDNDPFVLIERTDGKPEAEIMEDWKR